MKILREIECPNCKKKLIEVQLRRTYVRSNPKHKKRRFNAFHTVRGIYEWRVKNQK